MSTSSLRSSSSMAHRTLSFTLFLLLLTLFLASLPVSHSQPVDVPLSPASLPPSAADIDAQLLTELDVLIDLQQRKVQLLTDIQRRLHSTPSPLPSDPHPPPPSPSSNPLIPHSPNPPPSPPFPHPPPTPPHKLPASSPWSIPQFLSRASIFLVAIGATVIYQHFQRSKRPRPSARDGDALQREWRRERLRVVRGKEGLVRRRVERGEGVEAVVYGNEDEWREEEVGEGEVLDEGVGDFWDSQESDHATYRGVLGVDEKEGEEEAEGEGGTGEDDGPEVGGAPALLPSDDEYDEDDEDEW